jgi:hypothetical protein
MFLVIVMGRILSEPMPFAREGGILSTQPHLFVMGDEMSKKCVYLMLSVMLTLMADAFVPRMDGSDCKSIVETNPRI